MMQRLELLQAMADKESSEPVVVGVESWLESKDKGTFADYIEKQLKNKSSDVTLIIDDLILETGMYIPTDILFDAEKAVVKEFVKAASESDEIKFIKLYTELFEELFELGDIPDRNYYMTTPKLSCSHESQFEGGKWLTDEELRQKRYEQDLRYNALSYDVCAEVFSKSNLSFYKDFLDHYKVLPIEQLVERYKDQQFFRELSSK